MTKKSSHRMTPRERLADRLHSASIHLLRGLRRVDDRSGLSAPRLSALSVVVFAGPLRLGDLARAEQVRAPTMTRLVQELEREGLVRRRPDPQDARASRIEATAKGKRLLMQGRRQRVAALSDRLSKLSVAQLEALREGVDVLESVVR